MEFIGNIARKKGEASLLRVEAEKSRRAARIGAESGLFRVPRVVSLDEDAGVLEFERARGLVTFAQLAARAHPRCEELAERAGSALAQVHLKLHLDDSMRRPLPASWMGPGRDVVFLHGDLTSNNVCIDETDMELVIVDWSASPLVGRVPTCGPRGFDVIYFVRHLHMSAPWSRTLSWPADALSDRFIRAYVDGYGAPLDRDTWQRQREEISSYARQAVREKLRRTSLLGRPGKALLQQALYRSWRAYRPPPESLTRPIP